MQDKPRKKEFLVRFSKVNTEQIYAHNRKKKLLIFFSPSDRPTSVYTPPCCIKSVSCFFLVVIPTMRMMCVHKYVSIFFVSRRAY